MSAGKQPAKKVRATSARNQATTTQPSFLAADAFAAALEAVPADDWCRTWPAGRTIMLRRTSKKVKELVDKLRPPSVVCLSSSWDVWGWDDYVRNGTIHEKLKPIFHVQHPTATEGLEIILGQLDSMSARCRITKLVLQKNPEYSGDSYSFEMRGENAKRLAGVLAQCPALAHLDLSENRIAADGAERLAGVLGQCQALTHLNLSSNRIGDVGAGLIAGVLVQCQALSHLDLSRNEFGVDGAGRLAGVLMQCPALAHLDLSCNHIRADGAGRLAGVMAQCPALTRLNLKGNHIGDVGAGSLAGVLAQCASLDHLNLSENSIANEGAERLAGVLAQCSALSELNLEGNAIRSEGVRSLAGVLARSPSLTTLDLTDNGGWFRGQDVTEVLSQCSSLDNLDLRHSRRNGSVAVIRATWLGKGPRLRIHCGRSF